MLWIVSLRAKKRLCEQYAPWNTMLTQLITLGKTKFSSLMIFTKWISVLPYSRTLLSPILILWQVDLFVIRTFIITILVIEMISIFRVTTGQLLSHASYIKPRLNGMMYPQILKTVILPGPLEGSIKILFCGRTKTIYRYMLILYHFF